MALIELDQDKIIEVFTSPVKWAEAFLRNPKDKAKSLILRSYQKDYLEVSPKYKGCVLRQGRRSGKSVTLEIDCLWHAVAYPYIRMVKNKEAAPKPYRILVIAPYEDHIKEIWKGFGALIADSPWLSTQIKRIKSSDEFIIEFKNGSTIEGSCAGLNSAQPGTKLRGKTADFIYVDELDYIPRELMENVIIPIYTSHTDCKMRVASTPAGIRELFFEWSTRANELGWYHQHIPSWHPDNDNWSSIEQCKAKNIPINESTEFQVRSITTHDAFLREYGAEFTDASTGVFKSNFIEKCMIPYGPYINLEDPDVFDPNFTQNKQNVYIIGVDWNTYKNGGQIVMVEFCKVKTEHTYFDHEMRKDITIDFTGKYRLFYRRGIKVVDSTQANTRAEIIRLIQNYKVDYIYVDYGYGDTNIEELSYYGLKNPFLGIQNKLKVVNFGQYVEHWDPVLKEKVKKTNKNMMVNNAILCTEENTILLPKEEDMKTRLVGQMRSYKIKNVTSNGIITYEGEDHILDAFNLALYGFAKEYGPLLKTNAVNNVYYSTVTAANSMNISSRSSNIDTNMYNTNSINRDPDKPYSVIPRKIGTRSNFLKGSRSTF